MYEAVIEDRGKNFIFLRLSRECVEELELTCDQEFSVEVRTTATADLFLEILY